MRPYILAYKKSISTLIFRHEKERFHEIIAVACQLWNVHSPLRFRFTWQLFLSVNPLKQRSFVPTVSTPWPRSIQPTAIWVTLYHHNQSILPANQICVLDFSSILTGCCVCGILSDYKLFVITVTDPLVCPHCRSSVKYYVV